MHHIYINILQLEINLRNLCIFQIFIANSLIRNACQQIQNVYIKTIALFL